MIVDEVGNSMLLGCSFEAVMIEVASRGLGAILNHSHKHVGCRANGSDLISPSSTGCGPVRRGFRSSDVMYRSQTCIELPSRSNGVLFRRAEEGTEAMTHKNSSTEPQKGRTRRVQEDIKK